MENQNSFVVVYLIGARELAVVPEVWIKDLNNAKLKNNGKNSNLDFLVYWSATGGHANSTRQPNFGAPLVVQYYDTIEEVCYMCRVKKFFGEFFYFPAIIKLRHMYLYKKLHSVKTYCHASRFV